MNRRLFLLNGVAILTVVANHAAGWGMTAMFWWTHRYRDVGVPNYDQLGSAGYWLLVLLKQLTVFSVPAFLFVSGAFMAYVGRGGSAALNWKMLRSRLLNLVIPYLIWSVVYLAWEGWQQGWSTPLLYLKRLLLGQAVGTFFFIPLLVQCLLLSPWLVRWAAKFPVRLLIVTGALQALGLAVRYFLILQKPDGMGWGPLDWLALNWIFFYTAGIVAAQRLPQVTQGLTRFRWGYLALLIVAAVAAVAEPEWWSRSTQMDLWRGTALTLSTTLFSLMVLLTYLAFDRFELPFSKFLFSMGGITFGVYLTHLLFLEFTARLIYHALPWVLSTQFILQPLLILAGVGGPYLLLTLWMKSPLRAYRRYVFG